MSIHSTLLFKPNLCRLCFQQCDLDNLIEIYDHSKQRLGESYESKIRKYLNLNVSYYDQLPKTICWHCSSNLDSFHKFSEKVNEINLRLLSENYCSVAEKATYKIETRAGATHYVHATVEDKIDAPIAIAELPAVVDEQPDEEEGQKESEDILSATDDVSDVVEVPVLAETSPKKSKRVKKPAIAKSPSKAKVRRKAKTATVIPTDVLTQFVDKEEDDEQDDGLSCDDFPARDEENEEWPAAAVSNEFPNDLIKDGKLQLKGKPLLDIICKFYQLKCDTCEDHPRFKTLNTLFQHYNEVHGAEGYVTCCQNKYIHYPAIIMHMARHIQPSAFQCQICDYMVSRPRFLKPHLDTHKTDEEKPFHCDQCDKKFCWKAALDIHKIKHQPEESRKTYVCHVCGKRYDTPGGLSTHKKLHWLKPKEPESNICHLCAKNFATRTNLLEHMRSIHRPREENQIQCTECNKWLMNQRCLKSHMLLHSNIEYSCDSCEYVTKKKHLLQRHTITKHSTEKPFICHICQKMFKLKRALTVHLNKHNDTTVHACNFCERTFASSTNFYTHRKNMHPQQLQEMKEREMEEKRLKRVCAGIETLNETMTLMVTTSTNEKEKEEILQTDHVLIATG